MLRDNFIKLVNEVFDAMEGIDCPRNEDGRIIAGTPEVIQFDKMMFKIWDARDALRDALDMGKEESL